VHVVSQRPRSNPALVQKYGTGWLKLHRPIQGVSCFSGALQLPQRQTAPVVRVAERWVPPKQSVCRVQCSCRLGLGKRSRGIQGISDSLLVGRARPTVDAQSKHHADDEEKQHPRACDPTR